MQESNNLKLARAAIQKEERKLQAKAISSAVVETVKTLAPLLKGQKGEPGEKGEKGESIRGPQGPKGDSIVGPKGPKGNTVVGPAGPKGDPGADGKDGRDGSPDTPEQIRDKLSELKGEERLAADAVKGLNKFVRNVFVSAGGTGSGSGSGGGAGTTLIPGDSTYLRLDTANGPLTNRLDIVGSTGVQQLTAKAFAGQTQHIMAVKSSAGVDLMSVDKDGNIVVNNNTTNTPSIKFTPSGANTTLFLYMRNSGMVVSTSGTNVGRLLDFFPAIDGSSNVSGQFRFYGGNAAMYPLNPGSGNSLFVGLPTNKWNNVYAYRSTIDTPNIPTASTPSSAGDSGITGDMKWDSDYIYVCVATNTWKRAELVTW